MVIIVSYIELGILDRYNWKNVELKGKKNHFIFING